MLSFGVGVVIIISAIWLLAIATGWSWPYFITMEGVNWISQNPWESLVLVIFLLLAGAFFVLRLKRESVTVSLVSPYGRITITEKALREIIDKCALTLEGVQQLQSHIRQKKHGVEIVISCQFATGVVIPQISEQMQIKVKEAVETYAGIHIAEVIVLVREVRKAPSAAARVR
ncbi:MAG: alkaline shock response membrane anchor protein AmaP [Peptococcaceae bacterium]|nr:alkaline shock response membrane anchor protein AmaP [Peptococcaceae bacterium]